MKSCPHCQEDIYELQNAEYNHEPFGDKIVVWVSGECPNCDHPVKVHGAGDVDCGDIPSQDEIIGEAASKALEAMQRPVDMSVEDASRLALDQIEDEYPWFEPETSGSEPAIDLVLDCVDEQTPDEWSGNVRYSESSGYYLENASACPHCGSSSIFNLVVEETVQMVKPASDEHQFVADDVGQPQIASVSCGKCFNELSDSSSA